MSLDLVKRGQAFFGDGRYDGSFANAVAATNLCVIWQGGNGIKRVSSGTSGKSLAKGKGIAQFGNVLTILD